MKINCSSSVFMCIFQHVTGWYIHTQTHARTHKYTSSWSSCDSGGRVGHLGSIPTATPVCLLKCNVLNSKFSLIYASVWVNVTQSL